MTARKTFDDELLALQRIVRIIESFEDIGVKARIARYIRARYLEGDPVRYFPSAEEIAARVLTTPIEQSASAEIIELVEVDPQQVPLFGSMTPTIADRLEVCPHGSPLGSDCFGCEADRQVAKDRHSAPLGGVAE